MDIEDDLILLECYDKNFLILEESSDQEELSRLTYPKLLLTLNTKITKFNLQVVYYLNL